MDYFFFECFSGDTFLPESVFVIVLFFQKTKSPFYIYQIDVNEFWMNAKKKNKPLKSLEQLLEEAKTKKETLLKILKKITNDNSENQSQN